MSLGGTGASTAVGGKGSPQVRQMTLFEYPASASSQVGLSGDDGGDRDGFVFVNGDDTEVELSHRKRPPPESSPKAEAWADQPHNHRTSAPATAAARTTAAARGNMRLPADVASHPLPAKITLLPVTLSLGGLSFALTRKRCEEVLLLGAVVVGIAQLGYSWNEWALVGGTCYLAPEC